MSVAVVEQSTSMVLRAYGSCRNDHRVVTSVAREVWIPGALRSTVQSNLLKFRATEEVSRFYYLDDQKYL